MIAIDAKDALAIARSVRGLFSEGAYDIFALDAGRRHRFAQAVQDAVGDALAYLQQDPSADLKSDSALAARAFQLQWLGAFAAKDKHVAPLAPLLSYVADELLGLVTGTSIKVEGNRFIKERARTVAEVAGTTEVVWLRVAAFVNATEALLDAGGSGSGLEASARASDD